MPETMTNIPETTVIDPPDLRRLHDLTSRLLEENDLAALLQQVLDASVELLGADKGHLQLHDEHGHALKIAAHTGFDREFLEVLQSSPPEWSVAWAASHRGRCIGGPGLRNSRRSMPRAVLRACSLHPCLKAAANGWAHSPRIFGARIVRRMVNCAFWTPT